MPLFGNCPHINCGLIGNQVQGPVLCPRSIPIFSLDLVSKVNMLYRSMLMMSDNVKKDICVCFMETTENNDV